LSLITYNKTYFNLEHQRLAFIGPAVLFQQHFVLLRVSRPETGEEPERFFDFLPHFVLLRVSRPETGEEPERFFDYQPKLIRYAVKADSDAVLEQFGK